MEVLEGLDDSAELWLVQLPADVDVHALNGARARRGSSHDGQLRMQSSAGSFSWVDLEQPGASVCLTPGPPGGSSSQDDAAQSLRATRACSRRVVLFRTDEVPGAAMNAHVPSQKPAVPQPDADRMKVRFRPLGDTVPPPQPSPHKRRRAHPASAVGDPIGDAEHWHGREGKKKRKDKHGREGKKERKDKHHHRDAAPIDASAQPAEAVALEGEKRPKKKKDKDKKRDRS
jgi:hypothetical protein